MTVIYDYFSDSKIRTYYYIILLAVGLNFTRVTAQNKYELSVKRDVPIIAVGTGLSFTGWYLMKNTKPLDRDEINGLDCKRINSVDRWACSKWSPIIDKWSDAGLVVSTLLPLSLSFSSKVRDEYATLALSYFENIMLTYAAVSISKGLFRRTRPMAYNDDVPSDLKDKDIDLRHSFYSGHSAIAFSSVVFFATVYDRYYSHSKWQPCVWGGSLALASSVALFRVLAGKHFPTDVIVGAIMGGLTGYIVPEIHEKTSTENNNLQPIIFKIVFTF